MSGTKKIILLLLALALTLSLAACAAQPAVDTPQAGASAPADKAPETAETPSEPEKAAEPEKAEAPADEKAETPSDEKTEAPAEKPAEPVTLRVGSLKGPTTMGLVNLMKRAETEGAIDGVTYAFTMATDASEIAAGIVSGDLDIALVPANLAAVLYNKRTDRGVEVLDVNTLGVLWCVTGAEDIASVRDLEGKTVVMTGQGTTPEYALRHLLAENGVSCDIEFKSEATEVAAVLAADPAQIAVLPQPFATAAMAQNEALREAFSLSEEWDAVSDGSRMVTGVTIARKEVVAAHPAQVEAFIALHAESAEKAASDPAGTAQLVADYGIVAKAPIAQKALPKCGIACLTGGEMTAALRGYLEVLFAADPASVGGALPEDDFYHAAP